MPGPFILQTPGIGLETVVMNSITVVNIIRKFGRPKIILTRIPKQE